MSEAIADDDDRFSAKAHAHVIFDDSSWKKNNKLSSVDCVTNDDKADFDNSHNWYPSTNGMDNKENNGRKTRELILLFFVS